ncbi:MAG: RNA polymerase sigma factor [Saprospiraceae bacterium]|jgi:RNA polymerase sigma factor (sigma-70 family)|nr:RNA polymerase sigma factor [Saprospiraceae bacterium]
MHRDMIEQCKAGNRTAQFELYKQYSKGMYNVCLRMVHDQMDAEDVLQNAFVDIFTKMDSFRHESTIGAWIKRIVVNHCINFLKKKKLQWEELDDRHANLRDDYEPETNESRLSVEQVNKAIMMLPDGYRVVFSLYLLEGYDHEEISEILQISEATSKSQFSRAKAKLRDILSDKKKIN